MDLYPSIDLLDGHVVRLLRGDYDAETLPERLAVECYGGRVATVGYLPGRSTTSIMERIRAGASWPLVPADQVNHL